MLIDLFFFTQLINPKATSANALMTLAVDCFFYGPHSTIVQANLRKLKPKNFMSQVKKKERKNIFFRLVVVEPDFWIYLKVEIEWIFGRQFLNLQRKLANGLKYDKSGLQTAL